MTYNSLCHYTRITYKIWEGWIANSLRLSHASKPVKLKPTHFLNPKRRCLWQLRRKPRRKPKRKKSNHWDVGLWWWWSEPSSISGDKVTVLVAFKTGPLWYQSGGLCFFGQTNNSLDRSKAARTFAIARRWFIQSSDRHKISADRWPKEIFQALCLGLNQSVG